MIHWLNVTAMIIGYVIMIPGGLCAGLYLALACCEVIYRRTRGELDEMLLWNVYFRMLRRAKRLKQKAARESAEREG